MPSTEHEVPLDMIKSRPQLAPLILRDVFGIDAPQHNVGIVSEIYSELTPAQFAADAAVLCAPGSGHPLGIIVESQQRFDEKKDRTWPAYVTSMGRRFNCDVALLVLYPDHKSAQRCRPLHVGPPDSLIRPLALHPAMLPPITDPEQARQLPELAIWSAPAHADGPCGQAVVQAIPAAISTFDRDQGKLYYDYVASRLSTVARKILEETVAIKGYEWKSEFAITHRAEGRAEGMEKGMAKGRAEGRATSILRVLRLRHMPVSDEIRERITSCTDLDQLERWFDRAITVHNADDLFD
jgi:hypothetical protein